MIQAREPARQGRSTAAVRVRAWRWALWSAPLLVGACSSAASDGAGGLGGSPSGGGGWASGGAASASSASKNGGSGGSFNRGSSSSYSGIVGGASSSSASRSGSGNGGGMSAGGGASSASAPATSGGVTAAGGASYSGASSSSNSKGGSSMGGAGGAGIGSSNPGAGASGAVPSAGAGGGASAAGGRGSSSAAGGSTSAGGRTTGTSASTYPSGVDAGARDAMMTGDASAAPSCTFAGGAVTSTTYPGGLTLRKTCSPYLVGSISVYGDGVLTIEPGVTLKFSSSAVLSVGVLGPGRLVAAGSSSEIITFTSQESAPSPGFWRGLVFGGGTGSGSKVTYAQITAAGQNRDGALVGDTELPAYLLTVDHVTIDKVGDGASGILALAAKSAIAITNSSFVDVPAGRYPISVYAASFSSIGTGNTYPSGSAIEVMGGNIDTSVTWTNPGLPVVLSGDLVIEGSSSPVLTVGSGINLKFAANVAVQVGRSASGKIAISGTSLARVTLTSLSSTPVPGSWAGLQIWDSGKATISYADVRYGGTNNGDSKGNVTVESAAASVQLAVDHSSFGDSLGWGIYVPCGPSGQNGAIITVDTNTTYANNVLGTKGPGLTCGS